MKKVRTIRIDKEVSDNLDSICNRHGDVSWHIEQALNGYKPIRTMLGAKPKEIKEIAQAELECEFERVWDLYGKKGNRKKSKVRFSNLSKKVKQVLLTHIPIYVLSTPDKQFRKNFETYINQEAWNDETQKQNQVAINANQTSFVEKHTDRSWADNI